MADCLEISATFPAGFGNRFELMTLRACFIALLLVWFGPAVPTLAGGSGGVNAPQQLTKPYVVLISIDGFRWDYPDLFELPALKGIISRGFRAERLVPVFPTLTFPNHYSIATGLYPDRHGLVGNRFPVPEHGLWYALGDRTTVENGRLYHGTPLWVLAEQQGMVSAAYFFVGTEADIQGIRPSHWRSYSKEVPGDARVDQVLSWLGEAPSTRPHFITLYFEEVDDHSHWSGVGSREAVAAMHRVDGYLDRLVKGLQDLPHGNEVYLILVSDHGQAPYIDRSEAFILEDHIDLKGIRTVGEGSYCFLYFSEQERERISLVQQIIQARWAQGDAMRPSETPAHWRIGSNDRWPDLILSPRPGHAVARTRERAERLSAGAHGWSPDDPSMHGIAIGMGPGLRADHRLGPLESVDIFPLIAQLLGLESPKGLDSHPERTSNALKP